MPSLDTCGMIELRAEVSASILGDLGFGGDFGEFGAVVRFGVLGVKVSSSADACNERSELREDWS